MANGIGRAKKTGIINRERPGVTNNPSNSTSYTSNTCDKFKETLMYQVIYHYPQRHILVKSLLYKFQLLIFFNLDPYPPHTKNMIDTNVTVDDDSHLF